MRVTLWGLMLLILGCSSKEADFQKQPSEVSSQVDISASKSSAQASRPLQLLSENKLNENESTDKHLKILSVLKKDDVSAVSILSPRSLSLKLRLKSGMSAVFKPVRKNDTRAIYEVAAYRIAKLLNIERVPASVMREFPIKLLVDRLSLDDKESANTFRDAVLINENNTVFGAMIEWIKDVDHDGLKKLGGMSFLNRLLKSKSPADIKHPIAKSASSMVVFDHLIGNWDRYSGGNFFVSPNAQNLILLDHNGGFGTWYEKRKAQMEKRLADTERFSISLIKKLRNLTMEDLNQAVNESNKGFFPLLREKEMAVVLSRRDEVLRHVDSLILKSGEKTTLVFE